MKRVAPSALLALGVAIAIGLGAFLVFKARSTVLKHSENTQVVATTTPAPSPVGKGDQTGPVADNLDAARSGTIVAEDSTHDQSPASTPVSTASPFPQPSAVVNDSKARDVRLSEADRKTMEKERRKAERKRSRLEAMYQKHEISNEVYKKGQDEYKSEMAKYRSAIDGAGSANE
jgi:hypothetical protein